MSKIPQLIDEAAALLPAAEREAASLEAAGAEPGIVQSIRDSVLDVARQVAGMRYRRLHKAMKGDQITGHKYRSRKWDAANSRWLYDYGDGHVPAQHQEQINSRHDAAVRDALQAHHSGMVDTHDRHYSRVYGQYKRGWSDQAPDPQLFDINAERAAGLADDVDKVTDQASSGRRIADMDGLSDMSGVQKHRIRQGLSGKRDEQPTGAGDVDSYLRKIRTPAKRDYAQRYVAWLRSGQSGDEPRRGELSAMAAQAVRMDVSEMGLSRGLQHHEQASQPDTDAEEHAHLKEELQAFIAGLGGNMATKYAQDYAAAFAKDTTQPAFLQPQTYGLSPAQSARISSRVSSILRAAPDSLKHEIAQGRAPADNAASDTKSGSDFTVEHERDWTWVSFPNKPAPAVLDALRSLGAHWGGKRKAWYVNRHVTHEELEKRLGVADGQETKEPERQEQTAPQQQGKGTRGEAGTVGADGIRRDSRGRNMDHREYEPTDVPEEFDDGAGGDLREYPIGDIQNDHDTMRQEFGDDDETVKKYKKVLDQHASKNTKPGDPVGKPYKDWTREDVLGAYRAANDWRHLQILHSKTLTDKQDFIAHNNKTTKGDLDAWLMKRYGIDASDARSISNNSGDHENTTRGGNWIGERPEPKKEDYPDVDYHQPAAKQLAPAPEAKGEQLPTVASTLAAARTKPAEPARKSDEPDTSYIPKHPDEGGDPDPVLPPPRKPSAQRRQALKDRKLFGQGYSDEELKGVRRKTPLPGDAENKKRLAGYGTGEGDGPVVKTLADARAKQPAPGGNDDGKLGADVHAAQAEHTKRAVDSAPQSLLDLARAHSGDAENPGDEYKGVAGKLIPEHRQQVQKWMQDNKHPALNGKGRSQDDQFEQAAHDVKKHPAFADKLKGAPTAATGEDARNKERVERSNQQRGQEQKQPAPRQEQPKKSQEEIDQETHDIARKFAAKNTDAELQERLKLYPKRTQPEMHGIIKEEIARRAGKSGGQDSIRNMSDEHLFKMIEMADQRGATGHARELRQEILRRHPNGLANQQQPKEKPAFGQVAPRVRRAAPQKADPKSGQRSIFDQDDDGPVQHGFAFSRGARTVKDFLAKARNAEHNTVIHDLHRTDRAHSDERSIDLLGRLRHAEADARSLSGKPLRKAQQSIQLLRSELFSVDVTDQ